MMKEKLKRFIKEIEDLPELPNVALKIIEKIDDPEIDNVELTKFIELSPALTIKILKIINSPFYGLPQKINSLPQAIGLLGRKTVKNLALTIFILKKIINKYSKENSIWENLVYSLIATKFISKEQKEKKEELIISNILINIPLIVIIYLDFGDISLVKKFYETKEFKDVFYIYLKVLKEKWNIGEELILHLENFYKYCSNETKDVTKEGKILCCANKIGNFLALNGEDSEVILKETKEILPDFLFNDEFLTFIKNEAENVITIFELPVNKDFLEDIFIFFSKANNKISNLLIENEKLIESLKNINTLLSTALNNFPLGVLLFDNEKISLINVNAIEILDLNSKVLDLTFDNFLDKFLPKGLLNREIEFIRMETELLNGHPVELTYLNFSYLHNKRIIFLKSLKEEKELKEKYSDLKETYINILRCAGDGIVITDLKFKVSFANDKFIEILNELAGSNIKINIKNENLFNLLKIEEEDLLKINSEIGKLIKRKSNEVRLEVKSKYNKVFELTCTKFIYSGSLSGVQFIIRDVTEINRLKEDIIKNEVAVELAGATAHDLNQPLTTLNIALDLLKDKIQDEESQKLLEKIENSAMRISKIVKKISRITKYETKKYFGNGKIISIDDD